MDKDIVVVNKNEVKKWVEEGSKFAITKDAEQYILKLDSLITFLEDHLEQCKTKAMEEVHKLRPNEKRVKGKNIYIDEREYGDKYKGKNPAFEKTYTISRIDAKKVDEYMKKSGKLPDGVLENLRAKQIKIHFI